jgi:hypothetical protein
MIFSESLDQSLVAARKYVFAVVVSLVACVTPLYEFPPAGPIQLATCPVYQAS